MKNRNHRQINTYGYLISKYQKNLLNRIATELEHLKELK